MSMGFLFRQNNLPPMIGLPNIEDSKQYKDQGLRRIIRSKKITPEHF